MEETLNHFYSFVRSLSALDGAIVAVNLILSIAAKRLIYHVTSESDTNRDMKVRVFRATNVLIVIGLLGYRGLLDLESQPIATKAAGAAMALYTGYLSYLIFAYFIDLKFGQTKDIDGKIVATETYNSRMLRFLGAVFISILTLVAIIQVFGLTSLMEAGGLVGFIGVMLALTQAAWAPDLIGGLVILNSNLVSQGDVIETGSMGKNIIAKVWRIKVFHTEILDIVNNHRIMIRNSNFRNLNLHNLSRFASAKGLRESLCFKIGYDVGPDKVHKMLEAAFKRAAERSDINIAFQHEPQIRLLEAGDFACHWAIFFFIKEVEDVVKAKQLLREVILDEANSRDIALSTPMMHNTNLYGPIPTELPA